MNLDEINTNLKATADNLEKMFKALVVFSLLVAIALVIISIKAKT